MKSKIVAGFSLNFFKSKCMSLCGCLPSVWKSLKARGAPEAEVTGCYEPFNMGAKN